jgi:uncharacterized repeat protein (TIGR03806 family)
LKVVEGADTLKDFGGVVGVGGVQDATSMIAARLSLPLLAVAACAGAGDDPALGLRERPANPSCRPPSSANSPAPRLSLTGCVDPQDARRPAPGLIPYDVNSPLWSDGAAKQRFVALPDGERIRVKDCAREPGTCEASPQDDGHFQLPVGSVLVKTFEVGGRRIETRLLARWNELTWKGYSYAWNEAGTDADLVEDVEGGLKKTIADGSGGTQVWHFPGRAQCLQCHTRAAGISLGLTTAQLDRDFTYSPAIGSNQIETWERIGMFEQAPGRLAPLPSPLQPAVSQDQRTRSYLHVNCSNCHRPHGSFEGIDLRQQTPFAAMGLCNAEPEKGTLGVEGARRLVPGDPSRSLLSLRMHAPEEGRMPQIGTSVIDPAGTALVDDWIRSIQDCPQPAP